MTTTERTFKRNWLIEQLPLRITTGDLPYTFDRSTPEDWQDTIKYSYSECSKEYISVAFPFDLEERVQIRITNADSSMGSRFEAIRFLMKKVKTIMQTMPDLPSMDGIATRYTEIHASSNYPKMKWYLSSPTVLTLCLSDTVYGHIRHCKGGDHSWEISSGFAGADTKMTDQIAQAVKWLERNYKEVIK